MPDIHTGRRGKRIPQTRRSGPPRNPRMRASANTPGPVCGPVLIPLSTPVARRVVDLSFPLTRSAPPFFPFPCHLRPRYRDRICTRGGPWPRVSFAPIVSLLALVLTGCYSTAPSTGGGQTRAPAVSASAAPNPADVALPAGYRIEVVATGLTFPTSVTFDAQNRPCVVEAGYSYGEKFTTPRLLRIERTSQDDRHYRGHQRPLDRAVFHNGGFYIAEGGELNGGAIARIGPDHVRTPLIEHLPSMGDHHTNGPAVGSDGFVYFGIGTATNAGVVGPDDYEFGWLKQHPDFHDIPARDIKLAGINYPSNNPLKPGTKAVTGLTSPSPPPARPARSSPAGFPVPGPSSAFRFKAAGRNWLHGACAIPLASPSLLMVPSISPRTATMSAAVARSGAAAMSSGGFSRASGTAGPITRPANL